jgi:vacuolar-type H+-ATPase subunit I/STV1
MTTATAERQELHQAIERLSDSAILQIKDYVERVREAEEEERRYQSMTLDEIKAEIAAMEAKHGTTPNEKTIAAMEELRAGGGKRFHSIDELMRDLHDENDD